MEFKTNLHFVSQRPSSESKTVLKTPPLPEKGTGKEKTRQDSGKILGKKTIIEPKHERNKRIESKWSPHLNSTHSQNIESTTEQRKEKDSKK